VFELQYLSGSSLMRILRFLSLERLLLGIVVYGAITATQGCGEGDPNTKQAAAPQPQAEQDREREARQKAMQKK